MSRQSVKPANARATLEKSNRLLSALTEAQAGFIDNLDPRATFETLLGVLLSLTDSEYGFIGEVLYTDAGAPYLKCHAISNIAWNDETRAFFEANAPQGLEFHNLDTLFGHALKTGQAVIVNDPAKDPRRGGLPAGHPDLRAFLAMPFGKGETLVGMAGIANRPGGYDEALLAFLQPMLSTSACIIEATRNRTQRNEARQDLRESEAQLKQAQVLAKLGHWQWNLHTDSRNFCSDQVAEIFDARLESNRLTLSDFLDLVHPDDLQRVKATIQSAKESPGAYKQTYRILRADGELRFVTEYAEPVLDEDGALQSYRGLFQDVTDQQLAEEQLRQTSKMEAVGQLTGGVAHDFNNLLAIISGNLELLADDIGNDAVLNRHIAPARKAAQRSEELIRRLLAFSRKQALLPEDTDVNGLVSGFAELIRRSLGAAIDLQIRTAPRLWTSAIDPAGLENALLNLAVNARDAMPGAGRLTIRTGDVTLRNPLSDGFRTVEPGDYVLVAVEDDGIGMSLDLQERVFEPFFTTKQPGQGTGLGLSMIYGFVEQSEGGVLLHSKPEQGTTIELYLPCSRGAQQDTATDRPALEATSRRLVLVVEDEPDLRKAVMAMLEGLGYRTRGVADGRAAIELADSGQAIDLLVCDVALPNDMNGPGLARVLRQRRPELPVLFMSATAGDVVSEAPSGSEDTGFIAKPFSADDLDRRIRALLERHQPIRLPRVATAG